MIARRDLKTRLVDRSDLSPTCFKIVLLADDDISAVPGQFGMLACGDGLDPLLRRPFSLGGLRRRGSGTELELLVKEVGKGTALLRRLGTGTELMFLLPLGNGFTLDVGGNDRLALVAGGIGLPPVLFAAEVLAERGAAFDLFVGAATAAELLEVDRCRTAVEATGGDLIVTTDDGSAGAAGFVTDALQRRIDGGARYRRALACGPNPMLAALSGWSRRSGVEAELSLEEPMACGVGVCLGCVVELADGRRVPSCKEGPVFTAERLAERWWL